MSVLEAKRTTLADFEVMQEAYMLRNIDEQFMTYLQAWTNAQVQATDKKGKPVYKKFKDFFDYDKILKELKEENNNKMEISVYQRLAEINKKGGNE